MWSADEDYATGLLKQVALKNGGRDHVLFGENEGGAQRFHTWVDRLIAAKDDEARSLVCRRLRRGSLGGSIR